MNITKDNLKESLDNLKEYLNSDNVNLMNH